VARKPLLKGSRPEEISAYNYVDKTVDEKLMTGGQLTFMLSASDKNVKWLFTFMLSGRGQKTSISYLTLAVFLGRKSR